MDSYFDDSGGSSATSSGMLKGFPSNKSKKSLKSIVDRLAKQSYPSNIESQQFMAALSLTGASDFNQMHSEPEETFDQTLDTTDQALDLSLKRTNPDLNIGEESYAKIDSIGALDLSLSGSRSITPREVTGSSSPDFVLDLTNQIPWCPIGNNEIQPHLVTKGQIALSPSSNLKVKPPKDEQDEFQANHMRLLQFLSNHTYQQNVTGTEVDVKLLTCKYCRYASTEMSCMMTHLTTTHVSKKHANSSDKYRPSPNQMMEMSEYILQSSLPSENGPSPVKKRRRANMPHHVMVSGGQMFYTSGPFHPLDGSSIVNEANLPASLVQLVSLSQKNAALSKMPQKSNYDNQVERTSQERKAKIINNEALPFVKTPMAYVNEGLYIIPGQPSNSILEEKFLIGESSSQSRSSTLSPAGGSSEKSPTLAKSVNSSATEAEEREMKLNHLCQKLAKRMAIRTDGRVTHESQSSQPLQNAAKSRRRKSAGGKRQSIIEQTGTFSCEYCSKTFKRPLSLYGHLKQHSPLLKKHKKGGFFQCRTCPLIFPNFQNLLKHMREMHSEIASLELAIPGSKLKTDSQDHVNSQIAQHSKSFTTTTNASPVTKKTSQSRKTKPYSLREQARRDYLLDHDPMMDHKDIKFLSNLQSNISEFQKEKERKDTNGQANKAMSSKKQRRKVKKVLRGMKILLRLKKLHKGKKVRRRKCSITYAPGISWKRAVRKHQSKLHLHHLAIVLRYFTHDPRGHHCKLCDMVIRPFQKALVHLKKKHLKVLMKKLEACALITKSSKLPHVAHEPSSTSDSSDNIFVKMAHLGVEQYQCNLCLQIFQGRVALIDHLEMHREIYDAGVRSLSKLKIISPTANTSDMSNSKSQDPSSVHVVADLEALQVGHLPSIVPSSQASLEAQSSSQSGEKGDGSPLGEGKSVQASLSNGAKISIKQTKPRFSNPVKSKEAKVPVLESETLASNEPQKHVCKICLFTTLAREEMKRHMKKHCKVLLKCDQCSYQTIEKRFIIRHIQTVHEQRRPYTCELCVYSTAYKHHLKRHYKSHSVDLLACAKCSFCTLQEGKFQEHMQEHDSSPNIVMCDDCGLTFASSKMLKEHSAETHNKQTCKEQSPSGQKDRTGFAANWWENIPTAALDEEAILEEHRCDTCGFLVQSNDALMEHMMYEHLGTETFLEEQKMKKVKKRKGVAQHYNQLKMDMSVQCPQCGFITSKDQLKVHLDTHNSEETYACEHCQFETKSLDALQKHKTKHNKHKVSLTCLQCGDIQTDILSLRDHTRVHLIAVDEENPFQCSLCTFSTDSAEEGEFHLDQHNYVMEYKCQICMYSSPNISGLTSHCRLHRKLKATKHTLKKISPVKSHDSL